jgi:hypothetical protein
MAITVKKSTLYAQAPGYAAAETHVILPSGATSVAGISTEALPTHELSVPVPAAGGTVDIAVRNCAFRVTGAKFTKLRNPAIAGDTVVVQHVAGAAVSAVAQWVTPDFATVFVAVGNHASVNSMPNSDLTFVDGNVLRVLATAAGGDTEGVMVLTVAWVS